MVYTAGEIVCAYVLQSLNPHVPEGDGIAVVLEKKGTLCHLFFTCAAGSGPPQLDIVLDAHAVLENGDPCVLGHTSVSVKSGCPQENVVGLPFHRRLAGIGQGRIYGIDGAAVIKTGLLDAVGIQHLQLVAALMYTPLLPFH